jgi:phosphatidylserine decarboxylase
MRLDSAGWPFIGGALILALAAGATVGWLLAVPCVALGAFFAFFFRDPERTAPGGADAAEHVLSPADGRVLVAGTASSEAAPPGRWQ